MIEINSPIEDLKYDPITKKYRVVEISNSGNRNASKSSSNKTNSNKNFATFKIKPQKVHTNRNLIERKGLHIDFLVS